MHKKLGPLQAWQWAALVAGLLIVYYEYEKSKASAASSTGTTTSTDTTGPIDPSTGLPYASEVGSAPAYSGGGGVTGDSGLTSTDSGTSLQQELSDLGSIEGLMQGFSTGQPVSGSAVTASGLSTAQTKTLNTDLKHLATTLGKQETALSKLQKAIANSRKKATAKPPAKKKTTKPGGKSNPGHHVTTHPGGKKTATSSAPANSRQHNHVAPPAHQKAKRKVKT